MSKYTTKTMPDADTIIDRMSNVYGAGGDERRVIEAFAAKIAASDKVAPGVNLAFQFAIHDVSQVPGATPMLSAIMNMGYESYMQALFEDDEDFANECIAWHEQIIDEVKRRNA